MTTLVVGATGATGKLAVEQLLKSGQNIKVIVRPTGNLPGHWKDHENLEVIKANITELSVDELSKHIADCQSIICCLGHNLTLKGLFGKPRRLVKNSVVLITTTILKVAPEKPVKFVLMNTAGNINKDASESVSRGEKLVIILLRLFLPPHPDNEQAAEYLRVHIGQKSPFIEWVVVRPDNLLNHDHVTEYSVHPSPVRSAIFNPGKTSRINVGHFMSELITDADLWDEWKGQMPVIYNVVG